MKRGLLFWEKRSV